MPQFIPPPLNPDPDEELWVAPTNATRDELYEFETKRLVCDLPRLQTLAREGTITPESVRGTCWMLLLGVLPKQRSDREGAKQRMLREYTTLVTELLKDVAESPLPLDDDPRRIDVDIPRTLPTLHFYASHEATPAADLERHRGASPEHSQPSLTAANSSTAHGASPATASTEDLPSTATAGKGCSARPPPPAPRPVPFTSTLASPFTPNQLALRRIIHLFARLNAGAGYVQGMNEIVGHLLYAYCSGRGVATPQQEAEVFFSFQRMHQFVGDNFQRELDLDANGVKGTLTAYSILLARCDHELYQEMEKLSLPPEYYAFRWITLMFSQDFTTPDVLSMWDFLLSFREDLDAVVLFVAVAMAILVRDKIIGVEFSDAIQLLQNYPHHEIELREIKRYAEELMTTHGQEAARDGRGGGSRPTTPTPSTSQGTVRGPEEAAGRTRSDSVKDWVVGMMDRFRR
jgi:hypothetical protein